MLYDIIIVGGGPAGLTAAIYALRSGLLVLLLDESPQHGGQVLMTDAVDNYPGLMHISGSELGERMQKQAEELGLTSRAEKVKKIEKEDNLFWIETRKNQYTSKTVIIASGVEHRMLNIPGEEEFFGRGVSYCATCDGAFFKNKILTVVGGGDVALEDALYLSNIAKEVYLIHRRDQFRGTKILQEEIKKNQKIHIFYDTQVKRIEGNEQVEDIILYDRVKKTEERLPTDGVFMAVGMKPGKIPMECMPKTDEEGYICAGEDAKTSISGLFAAGDVRTKKLRQIITAAADGANAQASAADYIRNEWKM